jgi:hypothetical protein
VASLHTARVEGKFIDNQLAGADKQGGVAARRDWNCNVTAEPVGNNFCGVRTAQSAALQPGYQQVEASMAPRADSVAN